MATPTLRERAQDEAARFLFTCWDEDQFPVDPFLIADSLEIDVFLANLPDDVAGIFRKKPNEKPEIYIAQGDIERRQRFTCAHELGHYAHLKLEGKLEHNSDETFIERRDPASSLGTNPAEVFANEFAANLLMPAVAIRTLHARGMDAYDLSRFFDVSPTSMDYRLKNLGLPR